MATNPALAIGTSVFPRQRGRLRSVPRAPQIVHDPTPPGARPWQECWRDPIFEKLDYYIAIGWGHVPRLLIDKYEAEGPLPDRPPSLYGAFTRVEP